MTSVKRIKLVDENGRTVRVFAKFTNGDWAEEPKPTSPTRLNRPGSTPRDPADVARSWGLHHHNGCQYLQAPGLTLRWENVTPVFDRIAETLDDEAAFTLTVDQLRRHSS